MGDETSVMLYWEGKIVRSRTEVVPSVLLFTEVVPKNVARVGPDRSKQPQIGIPSQLLYRREVRWLEAALSEPHIHPLHPDSYYFRSLEITTAIITSDCRNFARSCTPNSTATFIHSFIIARLD